MQFSAFIALAIASLAVATPTRRNEPASSCTTGDLQCCEQTGDASSSAISTILASLGINVQDVTGLVGLTCSPITVIGVGQSSWWVVFASEISISHFMFSSANSVCCQDNSFGGVASIGCVPVTL